MSVGEVIYFCATQYVNDHGLAVGITGGYASLADTASLIAEARKRRMLASRRGNTQTDE
jgi:hypothetical protein